MSQTRIYAVSDNETDDKRLVRAATAAQAVAYVSKRFSASVATQEQLVRYLDDGVEVETAGPARGPIEFTAKVAGLQQQLRDIDGSQA